jgi:hypothetical protein
MLIKLLLTFLIFTLTILKPAFATQEANGWTHYEELEIKANLGRTIIAVDKKGESPVFYPIVVDKEWTKIYSPSIEKDLWLKPGDVVDLWSDRKVDGIYVAKKIFLWKRPLPSEEDIKRGGNSGISPKLERYRIVPEEKDGKISKVVVDTNHQNVYVYGDDNEVWYVSRCVTGKIGWQIPKGNYHVRTKERNRYLDGRQYGEDYKLWVYYWMPFYGGAGLHDAGWRYTFWIDPSYYGSHGCINLPFETAKYIYERIKVGTPVIIK